MAGKSRGFGISASIAGDWKATAVRASIDKLIYQMVFPYLGVYLVGLGASGAALGLANGLGMGLSAFYGLFGIWLMHVEGLKRVYLGGILMTAFAYLLLGLSPGWVLAASGIVAWWWGSAESGLCCNVVCGGSLKNEIRATAMGMCESVAQGTMSFLGPLLGAAVIGLVGVGVSGSPPPSALRPLFYLAAAGEIGCFIYLGRSLAGEAWKPEKTRGAFKPLSLAFGSFRRAFAEPRLRRFILISCLGSLPTGMVLPFTQLFAAQAKQAGAYTLAAMATASAIVSLVAGVPLGRLADIVGRKKTLFALAPFFLASNLLLVFARGPFFLVVSGICLGVYPVIQVIQAAMGFELVKSEDIGGWMAVLRFFRLFVGAALAILSGLIWDSLGGKW
ncbi:MAG TPA: hypothetical protein VIO60_04580, partial [Rectinemataceae bacterium]